MVNILKDVGDDLERGACFLPLDQLQAVQVDPENILEPSNREAVMTVMSRVLARAENHLENARDYIKQWPPEKGETIRIFTIVPLALAVATLAVIQKGGEGVLMKGANPKVSREFVAQVLSATSAAAADNEQLDGLLDLAAAYESEIKVQR
jgi:farnesyl-diphosphate farnesyltransferase